MHMYYGFFQWRQFNKGLWRQRGLNWNLHTKAVVYKVMSSWKGRWSHFPPIVLWTGFWEAQVDRSGRASVDKLQRRTWRGKGQTYRGRDWLQGQREKLQPEPLKLWTLRSKALPLTDLSQKYRRKILLSARQLQPCELHKSPPPLSMRLSVT